MTERRCWAVVPAAGRGARMGGEIPKQYLELDGRPVLAHVLERLALHPAVAGVVVVLAPGDRRWPGLAATVSSLPGLRTAEGGDERSRSVRNGLAALHDTADGDDWILVHDAARPCLRAADLSRLIERAGAHPVGGLLAVPVTDTLKHAGPALEVERTVDRRGLWRAQTPQMFRLAGLCAALDSAGAAGVAVTDEAQAMERAGARPLLVEGHEDNIKITQPGDLALAARHLAARAGEETP